MRTTTHFTYAQAFVMTVGAGSGSVKFRLPPNVSEYGGSPTTTTA